MGEIIMMKQTLTAGLPGLNLQLPEERIDTLVAFGRAMVKQNEVMNLTGITDDNGVANLHLLDSLTVLSTADLAGKTLIDVGCGAGFPGGPLAIAAPDAKITLLDSLGKRMKWLEEVREFPIDGTNHAVIVLRKVVPTPKQFPRRFAKIKQAPL